MEEDDNLLYIYDLKYDARKRLCDILDQQDKWEELGGLYMEYDVATLDKIKTESRYCRLSPTNQLLGLWGQQNHTVLELFILLSRMHHYRAMLVLQPLVPKKFHALITRGEENVNKVLAKIMSEAGSSRVSPSPPVENGNLNNRESEKDMKIGTCNLNKQCKETVFPQKVVFPPMESNVENDSPSNLQNTVKLLEHKKSQGPQENKENNRSEAPTEARRELSETQRKLSNASSISSVETSASLIDYIELKIATNGWDKNLILGRGGFGTVYKGLWKNTQVAIKKLETQDAASMNFLVNQQQQSIREIKYLNQFRHDNILPLYGHSFGGETPCLVYQYMENGSLEDRLQCRNGSPPLSWSLRCSIATGVARGLQFLHYKNSPVSSRPLIHGDIKSANILLDKSFAPKIGDFGLAREGPPAKYTHLIISKVHGTRPYLPADFLRSKKFSTKVDTYSFGIVLFEIATGLRAYEESRQKKFLGDYVKNYDETRLDELADTKPGADEAGLSRGLLSIGKRCVTDLARDRPEMEIVLEQLKDLSNIFEQSIRARIMLRKSSLSPTTPYTMQLYYDHLGQQRRCSIPNSTATPVGTGGSVGMRRMSPQPQPPTVVQPSVMVNNPHISVTPPSVGVQLPNSNNPLGQVPSRTNKNSGVPTTFFPSPCVTSPADELPLLSELGVSTPNSEKIHETSQEALSL